MFRVSSAATEKSHMEKNMRVVRNRYMCSSLSQGNSKSNAVSRTDCGIASVPDSPRPEATIIQPPCMRVRQDCSRSGRHTVHRGGPLEMLRVTRFSRTSAALGM